MRAIVLSLALAACAPVVAEVGLPDVTVDPDPGVDPDPDPLPCDDTFDVARNWVVPVDDYGAYRSGTGFIDDGRTFFHTAGYYQPHARTIDMGLGYLWDTSEPDYRVVNRLGTLELRFRDTGRWDHVEVVDWKSGTSVATIDLLAHGGVHTPAVLTTDGVMTVQCTAEGSLNYEVTSLEQNVSVHYNMRDACDGDPRAIAYNAAQNLVALSFSGNRASALLVDLDTHQLTPLTSHHTERPVDSPFIGFVPEVVFSPDGRWLATIGADGRALLHNTIDGALFEELAVSPTPVNQNIYVEPDVRAPFAWSHDGRLRARGVDDGQILVERTCDGAVIGQYKAPTDLHPNPDGTAPAPMTLEFSEAELGIVAVYEGGVQGLFQLEP